MNEKKVSIGKWLIGATLSVITIYGLVWVASKAWHKGDDK